MKINNVVDKFLNDVTELHQEYSKSDSYLREGEFGYMDESKYDVLDARNKDKYSNLYDRDEFISIYNNEDNLINKKFLDNDDTSATLLTQRGLCANTNHDERYLPEPLSSSIYFERMNNTAIVERLMELEDLASKAKKEAYKCYSESCDNIDKIKNQVMYDTIFEYQTLAGMKRAGTTIMCVIADKNNK